MKKINLAILVAVILVTVLPFVSAGCSVQSPASSSTIGGSGVLLNVTTTGSEGFLNCTFYAKSSSTANSSYSEIATFSNETGSTPNINGTFNSSIFEDSNDYVFNATCTNSSNNLIQCTTTTSVTIDNTVPTAPASCTPASDSTDSDGSVDFSCTVTGSKTTSCTLYFVSGNPGESSYSMTHSGNSCTKTITSMPEQSYTWYVTASDGTNSTSGSSSRINIDIQTGAGKAAILKKAEQEGLIKRTGAKTYTIISGLEDILNSKIKGIPIWLIGVLLVISIVIYIAYRRK